MGSSYVWSLALAALFMSACVAIYVPDIQQGNVITQEMVDQLKTGMTRRQVQFILGTPPVADPFHSNRWDYYYSYKRGKKYQGRRSLSLFFEADALVEIRDNMRVGPAEDTTTDSAASTTQ